MKTNTKMIVASLSLLTSIQAVAGLGGLNVQSNLGEPFSGSIVVTGNEAQALLKSGNVSVSGGGVQGTVVPQSNGNAVIRLRSAGAVNEPVLTFTVKAGNQTRQYSAMVNPARYTPAQAQHNNTVEVEQNQNDVQSAKQPKVRKTVQAEQARVERKSRPVRAKSRARNQNYTHPQALPPRDSNAQYHQVQTGEHLAAIAEKYRPHNMTLQQAMRALVRANPRAFRNGNPNVLYGNMALYIPTDAQWHAYATGKGSRRNLARRVPISSHNQVSVQKPSVDRSPVVDAPASAADHVEKSTGAEKTAAPVVPATPASEPVAAPASVEIPAASGVADNNVTVASSTAGEQSVSSIASTASMAVLPASAASSVEASAVSMPVSVPASVAAAPVESKSVEPTPAPVQPETQEQEEETDWMQYGLMGLGGLAVLGGAAYLLGRRKRDDAENMNDADDDFVVESVAVPTAADAAQRLDWGSQNKAPEPVFNDQDDNVFFGGQDVSEQSAVAEPEHHASANEFNLDEFNPKLEETQPQEQPEWLAELESFNVDAQQPAADESDWDVDGVTGAAVAAAAGAATLAANSKNEEEAFADFTSDEFVVAEADGNQWLEEVLAEESAQEQNMQPESDVSFDSFAVADEPAVVTDTHIDDFDFNIEASEQEVIAEELNIDGFAVADEFAADLVTGSEPIMEIAAEEPVDEISFDIPESVVSEEISLDVPATVSTDDALSFDLPETSFEEPSFDVPQTVQEEVSFEIADEGLSFETTEITDAELNEPLVSVAPVEADVEELSFDLNEEPVIAPVLETAAVAEDAISSDDVVLVEEPIIEPVALVEEPEIEKQQDVGFVTGAVGMEAPLEAKLELAKMYLEIDDAVAARETLRELIGESSGELQAQAQSLLSELGG